MERPRKPARARARVRRRKRPATRRHPSYYLVAGVDLRREMERLRALPAFARGPLARSAPELKVRRARRRPNRLGFAVPGEWRISVTAYPEIRPGDVLETLLHELVHLHVGRRPGGRAWHGRAFKRSLARAMAEAYGIVAVTPRSTLHGTYAAALEERRLREGEQLELPLAG
ncbi:MAG: hypothetical protein GEU88_18270 [Solirubrobacterales bacterium]|nr:hypothetical protein [Solirubrobacterales bacterium]